MFTYSLADDQAEAAAQSVHRRVTAQAVFEVKALLRNGEQLLVSMLLPALALIGLHLASVPTITVGRWESATRIEVLTPGILAMAVISTAFTGQAILLAFERRHGVLRLLGTTPLGRGGLLAAKALSVTAVLTLQIVALGSLAAILGWRPPVAGFLLALVVMATGAAAFTGLALLLGGWLRAEAVLAWANLLWVLFMAGGAVLVPLAALPSWAAAFLAWLPPGALAEGLRVALVTGAVPWAYLATVLAWSVVFIASARRMLRWSD